MCEELSASAIAKLISTFSYVINSNIASKQAVVLRQFHLKRLIKHHAISYDPQI